MSFQHRAQNLDSKRIKHERQDGFDASLSYNELNPWSHCGGHSKSASRPRPDGEDSIPSGVYRAALNEQNSSVRRRQAVNTDADTETTCEPSSGFAASQESSMTQQRRTNEAFRTRTWGATISQRAFPSGSVRTTQIINKPQTLQQLGAEVEILRQDHSTHIRRVRELEAIVEDGEIMCGQMIQKYLELGRAIEIKKKHVHEDKRTLSRELSSKDDVMGKIHSIMAQMNALMADMQNGLRPPDDAFATIGPGSRD